MAETGKRSAPLTRVLRARDDTVLRLCGWLAVAVVVTATSMSAFRAVSQPERRGRMEDQVATGAYVDPTIAAAQAEQRALMKAGLTALYERGDHDDAIALFRTVLERNARHYGATYQLATALDRAGRPREAQSHWRAMLDLAEAARDEPTLSTVRARLAAAAANGGAGD